MKRITLFLFLGLISSGEILAQDSKKWHYQADFGTTLTVPYKKTIEIWSELENHPKTDYTADIGYFFEFILSFQFDSRKSIQTGLTYSHYSTKINDRNGLLEHRGTSTNSYLTIPLLFKYRLSEKMPLSIASGPYLSYLVGAKEKGISYFDTSELVTEVPDPIFESFEPTQTYNRNVKKNFASIDYGLALQLDYEINAWKKFSTVLLTRFNYGLKDVITNDLVTYNSANYWKNYSLIFGVGLKF